MLAAVVKRRPGRPRTLVIATKPRSWETPALAKQVAQILAAVDAPPVDSQVRLALQRIYHRHEMFGGDGRGHVTLLLRTILESEGNHDALMEPIVSAVGLAMRREWTGLGLAWIEAFDQIKLTGILQTMRGLDLFSEQTLPLYLANVLRNKLFKIFATAKPAVKPLAKREPKPPAYLARVPGVERNVALGLEMLKLRSAIQNNRAYGRQVRRQFDVEAKLAINALKVARIYGARPEIYTRLSWNALVTLASPALPAAARAMLERRILAGERITADEIRAGFRKRGRQADQRAQQRAA
ncbi:hypothetical protein [Nitrobacter sp. JJSN]|uniref:hypothetical protein n=1 Tax=Nitrobacter sp. JJSN TaxID=3453033 RepID=UPI003F771A58